MASALRCSTSRWWLQKVSNCIDFDSKPVLQEYSIFDLKFGSHELITFLCIIRLNLRVHQRGIKASKEVCFGACLIDRCLSLSSVLAVVAATCLSQLRSRLLTLYSNLDFPDWRWEVNPNPSSKMFLQELPDDPYSFFDSLWICLRQVWRQVHNTLTVTTVRFIISKPAITSLVFHVQYGTITSLALWLIFHSRHSFS